jgi:hypothetical protein
MTKKFQILIALGLLASTAGLVLLLQHQAELPIVSAETPPATSPAAAAPATTMQPANAPAPALNPPSAEDLAKAAVLDSVLAAHNDNDLRLDRDLKELSEPAKRLFQEKYRSLPAEKRNALGTIVFLLGRNLRTEHDLDFMEKVLASTCRSLQNCDSDPPPGDPANLHSESGMELTLAYPQIMALKGLERILLSGPSHPLFQRSLEMVISATHSPIIKVAQVARSIQSQLPGP